MYSGYRRPQFSRMQYQQYQQPLHPSQSQPLASDKNLGRDIHSFMDGLNKIVQILYSSIPVLELLRFISKYCWKFCSYLGGSTLDILALSNVIPWYSSHPEVLLESMWNQPSKLKYLIKGLYLLAGFVMLYTIYRRRNSLSDVWEEESDKEGYDISDEETEVLQPEIPQAISSLPTMDIKSEEDIKYNPSMHYGGSYQPDQYEEYPVMF